MDDRDREESQGTALRLSELSSQLKAQSIRFICRFFCFFFSILLSILLSIFLACLLAYLLACLFSCFISILISLFIHLFVYMFLYLFVCLFAYFMTPSYSCHIFLFSTCLYFFSSFLIPLSFLTTSTFFLNLHQLFHFEFTCHDLITHFAPTFPYFLTLTFNIIFFSRFLLFVIY